MHINTMSRRCWHSPHISKHLFDTTRARNLGSAMRAKNWKCSSLPSLGQRRCMPSCPLGGGENMGPKSRRAGPGRLGTPKIGIAASSGADGTDSRPNLSCVRPTPGDFWAPPPFLLQALCGSFPSRPQPSIKLIKSSWPSRHNQHGAAPTDFDPPCACVSSDARVRAHASASEAYPTRSARCCARPQSTRSHRDRLTGQSGAKTWPIEPTRRPHLARSSRATRPRLASMTYVHRCSYCAHAILAQPHTVCRMVAMLSRCDAWQRTRAQTFVLSGPNGATKPNIEGGDHRFEPAPKRGVASHNGESVGKCVGAGERNFFFGSNLSEF